MSATQRRAGARCRQAGVTIPGPRPVGIDAGACDPHCPDRKQGDPLAAGRPDSDAQRPVPAHPPAMQHDFDAQQGMGWWEARPLARAEAHLTGWS